MTETQATPGATGAPTTQADPDDAENGAPAAASGRAAVGRATVPGDSPSPKYTRAPGMVPPPDRPAADRPAPDGAGPDAGGAPKAAAAPLSPPKAPPGPAKPPVPPGAAKPPAPPGAGKPPASPPKAPAGQARGSGGPGAPPKGPAGSAKVPNSAGVADPSPSTRGRTAAPQPGGGQTTGRAAAAKSAGAGLTAAAARIGAAVQGTVRPSTATTTTTTTTPAGGRTSAAASAAAVGAARVSEAVRAARSTVSGAAARGPRRARLNLKRIDPWSVMKFSFAVSLVLFIVVIVATAVLYMALDAMGVFESINSSLTDLVSAGGGAAAGSFKITAKGVLLTAGLVGLVNVVLLTALATLSAFIYNVCADLVGGIEVTLAERD